MIQIANAAFLGGPFTLNEFELKLNGLISI